MQTVKEMDWLGPRLPDDGDTVHSPLSLLSCVGGPIALQSNLQCTCSLVTPRQHTVSSNSAFSVTVWGSERELE